MSNSLKIILKLFKESKITEEEVIQLITDLYSKNNFVSYPYIPSNILDPKPFDITYRTTSTNKIDNE